MAGKGHKNDNLLWWATGEQTEKLTPNGFAPSLRQLSSHSGRNTVLGVRWIAGKEWTIQGVQSCVYS